MNNPFKSILCLNGHLPEPAFFKTFNLPICAADGAANYLMHQGIMPELVVGDLDSLTVILPQSVEQIRIAEQDRCDYEKALEILADRAYLPCLIVGLNGGELDHILHNISVFMQGDNCFWAPPIYGMILRLGEAAELQLQYPGKISLLGLPHAQVNSRGLQWELQNYAMHFPGRTSCLNQALEKEVYIEVKEGQLLLLVHHGQELPLVHRLSI